MVMALYDQYSRKELVQRINELENELEVINKRRVKKENDTNSILGKRLRALHDPNNGYEILLKTCDTLFLLKEDGFCIDAIVKLNYSFMKESDVIGRNVFELLPTDTRKKLKEEFDRVLKYKIISTQNYELIFRKHTLYFKCIIQLYDDNLILLQYRDITQRMKIKKNLETANLRLKETNIAAKIGQWTYNTNTGIITYYGNAGGLYNDYQSLSMPITQYYEYVHPDDLEEVTSYMLGNRDDVNFMDYRISKNENKKEILYFRTTIIRMSKKNDELIIEGYIQNISDIINKRNELEMVTNAVNMSNDVIFGAKKDGGLLFANDLYRKYWNIPKDANVSDYTISNESIYEHTRHNWDEMVNILTANSNYKHTIEWLDGDNNKSYFACSSYVIKNEFGEDTIWCFWKNITKQTDAENLIKTTNRLLNAILENIPTSIFVKDSAKDFRYIYVNKVARNSSIIKNNINPIDKTDFELFPQEEAEIYRQEDLNILETRASIKKITQYLDDQNNPRTVDELKLMVPKEDEDSILIIDIGWDITEMKKIESELIKAKEKAEQADRLKSAFLSNMSHEIRTPLNAIVGFSRIISEIDDAAERKKYFDIVESNNTRLLALINEILDLSRIESGAVEFFHQGFNLKALFQELHNNLALSNSPNVNLVYEAEPEDLWITTDKNRLYQVLANLITNAQKFTKQGEIRFGYKKMADQIYFFVSDTGIGIPEDKMETIFNRFVKVDSLAPGTGLGLAICKTIVERLGGNIDVTSAMNEGTNMFFYLPYIPTHASSLAQVAEKEISKCSKKEAHKEYVILVVDDIENDFKLIDAILGKIYTLLHAYDGREAIQMFRQHKPDLVFMDIKIPITDGVKAAKAIRQQSASVPIIAISAYPYEEEMKKMEEYCHFNEFLSKPINKNTLIEILDKYL